MAQASVRIATRTSALALWQANYIADRLRQLSDAPLVELVPVVTTGDQNQSEPLRQLGGTGIFTREVQNAVLDGRADIAVHSLKDLPTISVEGLVLAAVPERAPRGDALLLPLDAEPRSAVADLPAEARVGTSSPRRQAQLLHVRPDLRVLEIRGNVDTRLRKLDDGEFDAILLAEAGLTRLGLTDRISISLAPPEFYPAVSQGALGVECREEDSALQSLLKQLTCPTALSEVVAERSLLRELRAGCHAPLGTWTSIQERQLSITGVLLSLDGVHRLVQSAVGPASNAVELGVAVAQQLIAQGGQQLLVDES